MRHTPPAPLERGDLGCCFFVGNEWFVAWGFPSREGIKGCVTVRSAAWGEMFLLLFGDVVFLGFG